MKKTYRGFEIVAERESPECAVGYSIINESNGFVLSEAEEYGTVSEAMRGCELIVDEYLEEKEKKENEKHGY